MRRDAGIDIFVCVLSSFLRPKGIKEISLRESRTDTRTVTYVVVYTLGGKAVVQSG